MALINPTPMFSMGLPNPSPIVMRPLLGLDLISSELNAPPGSMLDLKNMIVRPKGLYRIPGYDNWLDGAAWSPSDTPSLIVNGWGSNGIEYPFLITQNRIFLCSWSTGYTEVPWTYTTGTIAASGTTVTGSGTLWLTFGIKAGDVITIGASSYTILSVNSDTDITLTSSAGTVASGTAYSIARILGAGNTNIADACVATDLTLGQFLVIATTANQLVKLYPQTQAVSNLTDSAAKQPSTGGFSAQAVCFSSGRIFAGNTNSDSEGKQRVLIRWSKATDVTDFSDSSAYLYLTSQAGSFSGEIRKMITMGTLMVVYLDDAIFVGTPSNVSGLPLAFQQVPSGGIGIVGQRAISSVILPSESGAISGHFFVGFDNVYFLSSSNLSITPIGNRIIRDSVMKCQYPSRIQSSIDWQRRRVRFGFPRTTAEIENIYDFDWETKEWSYEARKTWLIGDLMLSPSWSPVQMYTATGDGMITASGDAMCLTWAASSGGLIRANCVENNGTIWQSTNNANALNPDSSVIPVVVETMDYDEGAPGMVKFWRMLRVKVTWDTNVTPTVPIVFNVELSMDRGRTYRSVGNLTINVGNDEGYVNFRATGPHIRFRLTSTSAVTPYYITEITRTASIRGTQQSLRQQNAVY